MLVLLKNVLPLWIFITMYYTATYEMRLIDFVILKTLSTGYRVALLADPVGGNNSVELSISAFIVRKI